MDHHYYWFFFLLLLVLLLACPGSNMVFFYGIVQGFISPFVLIAKLLGAHKGVYAENNTGMLYWAGYILGILVLLGGGGGGYARTRR